MSKLIESLESRTLFAAHALAVAIEAFHHDAHLMKKDVAIIEKAIHNDPTIPRDERRLHAARSDKAIRDTEIGHYINDSRALNRARKLADKVVGRDLNVFISVDKKATKNPNNAKLQAKLSSAESTFANNLGAAANSYESNASTLVSQLQSDYNVFAAAHPNDVKLQSDVNTIETTLSNDLSALFNEVNQAYNTDISAIATAIAS